MLADLLLVCFVVILRVKQGDIDLVLISPQVRFLLNSISKLVSPFNIPCSVIDMRTFGTMNGKEGLKLIQKYENNVFK